MDSAAKSTFRKILQGRDSKSKPCWPNPEESAGDIYQNCKFGGRSCWEARGPAREKFQVLAPEIRAYLKAHSDPVSRPVTWTIYMIGITRQSSRPTIMFCSEDKSSRNTIRNRVKESGLLDDYPGFGTGACSQEFRRFATDTEIDDGCSMIREFCVLYDRSEVGPGMYVYLKSNEAGTTLGRKARCGGILVNESKYFLQTVAHVFDQEFDTKPTPTSCQDEDEDDFEFDLDDDDDDVNIGENEVAIYSRGSATPEHEASSEASPESTSTGTTESPEFSTLRIESLIEPVNFEEASGHSSLRVPALLSTLHASFILSGDDQTDLDYCLLEIPQSELAYFEEFINQGLCGTRPGCPKKITCSGPKDVAVSLIRGGIILNGRLSGTPTFMSLPGNPSVQEVWVVRHGGTLLQGDCGSWVVDATGETLYGHIVAGDLKLGIAYMVPAYLVFEEVRLRFGGSWHLASKIEELSRSKGPISNIEFEGSLHNALVMRDSPTPRSELNDFELQVPIQAWELGLQIVEDARTTFFFPIQRQLNSGIGPIASQYTISQETQWDLLACNAEGMPRVWSSRHSASSSERNSYTEECPDFSSVGESVPDEYEFVPGAQMAHVSQLEVTCHESHSHVDEESERAQVPAYAIDDSLYARNLQTTDLDLSLHDKGKRKPIPEDWEHNAIKRGCFEHLALTPKAPSLLPSTRKGKLSPEVRRKANRMRRLKACWNCWIQKVSCSEGEACDGCKKLAFSPSKPICSRLGFRDLVETFFPEFLYSHFNKRHVVDLVLKYSPNDRIMESVVEVSTGSVFTPMEVAVSIFRPNFQSIRPISEVHDAPVCLNDHDGYEATRKLCDKHINSMIRSGKYVLQTTAGNSDALSSVILQVCKRYLENSPKHSLQSERAHRSFVAGALKLHAFGYFMGHIVTFDEESGRRVCEIVQDPAMAEESYRSSRALNRQIKYVMSKLLRDMAEAVLIGLEKSLRTRTKDSWADCFCAMLILSLYIENVQIAANTFVEVSMLNNSASSPLSQAQSYNACLALEEYPFKMPISLFHEIYRSHEVANEGRPREGGFNPLADPNIQDLDPAAMQMITSIRNILSSSENEIKELADRPLVTGRLASKVFPRVTGRLASKFLLSFFHGDPWKQDSSHPMH